MSILRAWRRSRLAVGAAVAAVVSAVTLVPASPASADPLTGNIVVSSPSTGKVAANTAKQVIILNLTLPSGTTLSEDTVASVNLGAARCTAMEWYIVTGTTQIAAKTPDDTVDDTQDGCAPTGSTTTGETIVITFTNGDTLTKAGSNLFFITPPNIADLNDAPVITENSAAITDADDQVQTLAASGGQYVRIKAADDFTFNGGTAAALSVNIGGKALTEVKAYSATNTVLTGPGQVADAGNYLIGKTATGMSTTNQTVVISQGGVSRTFQADRTGITIVNAPVITGLNVTAVKANVATNITVTGTGLASTSPATTTATVCGVNATVATAPNAQGTSMVITVPDSGIVDDADGLGLDTFAGTCPVVVTANGVASRQNEKSMIAIVKE